MAPLTFELDNSWQATFFGEITFAEGFEASSVYIEYVMKLPVGWFADDLDFELTGCTQLSTFNRNDKAVFAFPISMNLFCKEHIQCNNRHQSNNWPTILLRVISVDYWERHRVVGHGFVSLPREPGRRCLEVVTVKLVPNNIFDRLCDLFLGLSESELYDQNLSPSQQDHSMCTASSGKVHININTVLRADLHAGKRGKQTSLHNTVADVLMAFERAKYRMLSLRRKHNLKKEE